MDKFPELLKKKLEILLKDKELVEDYLKTYGSSFDMKHVEKIRKSRQNNDTATAPSAGDNEEPTFEIKVKCPACQHAGISCYELKAKSQMITTDVFTVSQYQGIKGFRTVNYNTLAVTVCPTCLFASPDKKDFITFSSQPLREKKSQLSTYILNALKEKTPERKKLLDPEADAMTLFKAPRSPETAQLTYTLSVHRALVEAECEAPFANYKLGMYFIKSAKLAREMGRTDEDSLRKALQYLEKCFSLGELSNSELEYQLLYIVSAINLRLGNEVQCRAYMAVLEKIERELALEAKKNPEVNLVSTGKWLEKIKELWAMREDADLWR